MTKTEAMRIQVVGAKDRLPRASAVCHKADDVIAKQTTSKRTKNEGTAANHVAQLDDGLASSINGYKAPEERAQGIVEW